MKTRCHSTVGYKRDAQFEGFLATLVFFIRLGGMVPAVHCAFWVDCHYEGISEKCLVSRNGEVRSAYVAMRQRHALNSGQYQNLYHLCPDRHVMK